MKCSECNGTGVVALFSSTQPCKVCGGTGEVPVTLSSLRVIPLSVFNAMLGEVTTEMTAFGQVAWWVSPKFWKDKFRASVNACNAGRGSINDHSTPEQAKAHAEDKRPEFLGYRINVVDFPENADSRLCLGVRGGRMIPLTYPLDEADKLEMICTGIDSGFLTVNEARAAIDEPPIAGGDIVIRPDPSWSPKGDASGASDGPVEAAAVRKAFREAFGRRGWATKNMKTVTNDKFAIPADAKRHGVLRNFAGEGAEERAYRLGMFFLAVVGRTSEEPPYDEIAMRVADLFCRNHEIPLDHPSGSKNCEWLIPAEFHDDISTLREKYGVFRRHAAFVPTPCDNHSIAVRNGGRRTAFFVGDTDVALFKPDRGSIRLSTKSLICFTRFDYDELYEANAIVLADMFIEEIAYAMASKEDQVGFCGMGDAKSAGIIGIATKLAEIDNNPQNTAGLVVASGEGYESNWDGITLSDMKMVVAKLPGYADRPDETTWFCSRHFAYSVMGRLSGIEKNSDIWANVEDRKFLGYPIAFVDGMPKTSQRRQVPCLFGCLRLAAKLGQARDMTIRSSMTSSREDTIAILVSERIDIVCNNVGDSISNPRDPVVGAVPGPVVGLMTPA